MSCFRTTVIEKSLNEYYSVIFPQIKVFWDTKASDCYVSRYILDEMIVFEHLNSSIFIDSEMPISNLPVLIPE